jgi:predicted GNAT family N-acyltransferase
MGDLRVRVAKLPQEWGDIVAIRVAVFHQEQGIDPSLDFDGKDESCVQIIAYLHEQPVGTARLRFLDANTAKIERLAVLSSARGKGIGKQIMQQALLVAASKNITDVVLHAQLYIKGLHEQLGFVQEGEPFAEAGIPHVKMRRKERR